MDKTYSFSLPGVTCVNCVTPIENILNSNCQQLKIRNFRVFLIDKTLNVTIAEDDDTPAFSNEIVNLLDNIGVECNVIETSSGSFADNQLQNAAELNHKASKDEIAQKKNKENFFIRNRHWFLGALGVLGGAILLLSTIFFPLPVVALLPVGIGAIALTLIIGGEFFYQAFKKLFKTRTLTMDLLFTISTTTTIAVSIGSFFVPWLKPLLDAGLLIFGFRHIGLGIDELLKNSMQLSKSFVDRLPPRIRVIENNQEVYKDVNSLEIDDEIIIYPNETIPVDGIAINNTEVDETILTGSSWPKCIEKNTFLRSGIKVAPGVSALHLKVTAKLKDSYCARYDAQIKKIINNSMEQKTTVDKILKYFIPIVIAVGVVAAVIMGFFFPVSLALQSLITILVSACPCTLGLIIPLAKTIGFNKAKNHGIIFKDNSKVEKGADPDWIFFDFNGTVTEGALKVTDAEILHQELCNFDEFYTLLYLIEKNSPHPVAKAISDFASVHIKDMELTGFAISEIDLSFHSGIRARINGEIITVGNLKMMEHYGIKVPSWQGRALKAGDGVIYLARGNCVVGNVVISDPVRSGMKAVIQHLKNSEEYKNGRLKIGGITGADEKTAQRIAAEIGMDRENVFAGFRGGDENENAKAKLLKSLSGKKIFIGDGTNDEAAFKAADFSVAIKSLNDNFDTQKQADAVISNIKALPVLLEISKQTVNNIKQNLIFSFSYNLLAMTVLGCVLIAIGFAINPAVGVILMVLQSALVLANALRFKEEKIKACVKDTGLNELQEDPLCEMEHETKSSGYSMMQQKLNSDNETASQTTEIENLNDLDEVITSVRFFDTQCNRRRKLPQNEALEEENTATSSMR